MENTAQDVQEVFDDAKKNKLAKLKEYENMFRILQKQRDYDKIKSLATELEGFDPGNKSAKKWLKKAENKLSGGFWKRLFSKTKKVEEMNKESVKTVEEAGRTQEKNQSLELLASTAKSSTQEISSKESPDISSTLSEPELSMEMASVSSMFIPEKQASIPEVSSKEAEIKTPESALIEKKETEVKHAPIKAKPEKPHKEFNLLGFSKLFANFTVAFIVLTAGFLYVEFIDQNNTVLGLVGVENTGSKLHSSADELSQKEREVATLKKEIEKLETGYQNPDLKTIDDIRAKRINWPDVLFKIDEVTNSVYELNDFFKYIEYIDYAFDADRQTIRISGKLSDPQGNNLTKLVELENAFKYYPKDQQNPDDPTQPFFKGFKELTTLNKTLDQETGRYVSNFQLSFDLNEN